MPLIRHPPLPETEFEIPNPERDGPERQTPLLYLYWSWQNKYTRQFPIDRHRSTAAAAVEELKAKRDGGIIADSPDKFLGDRVEQDKPDPRIPSD